MKNLLITYALLCFLTSCSEDLDSNQTQLNDVSSEKSTSSTITPENKLNPFDKKGLLYYNALQDYQAVNPVPNSIGEITNQIKYLSCQIEKRSNTRKGVITFNDSIVEAIMSDPDSHMINIVQNSALSTNAKSTLISFLQGLINHRHLDFAVSYGYIVDYEETIIDDNPFDDDETETILTITSISRYSLYSESERKDKDWDLSAGNKPAKKFFAANESSIITVLALLNSML
ncbi:hypothetical protein [Flavobacterium sp.]|uniref:hypothetical protein n=1 Tax=Flavobacterium sp. TaxID=239 RepID=UPI0031E1670B